MVYKDWIDDFFDENWLEYGFAAREGEDVDHTLAFVEWALGGPCKVLDLACGVGRVAIPLAALGYEVLGVDFQPDYVEAARARAQKVNSGARFDVVDMREMSYVNEFDAVICLWTSFGYFDDDTNLDILERVLRALRPGGTFVLQVINRDWVIRHFQPYGWQWAGQGRILEERRFDLDESAAITDWTFVKPGGGQTTKETWNRLYSWHELKRMLEDAGFVEAVAWGAVDEPLTINHNAIWAVAKRP
ncbi:MAG: methyltransferase domain-containing protein [Candidatus Coatesbacteria bacterium]|nr:MAG: methyltransferase domain-containing protein [Candidatus Coatesbacteria bacterium]